MADLAALGPGELNRLSLRFGADRRLLKRAQFLAVYEKGRRARGRFVTLFRLRREDSPEPGPRGAVTSRPPWRLGITASRKSGGAVERNRQRRRIREFFRAHQREIPEGWDFVVNTTPGLNHATHEELSEDLRRLLRQADRRGERPGPPQTDPAQGRGET